METTGDCHDFISEEEQDVFEGQAFYISCLLEHAVGLESEKVNEKWKSVPLIMSSALIRIPHPLFY